MISSYQSIVTIKCSGDHSEDRGQEHYAPMELSDISYSFDDSLERPRTEKVPLYAPRIVSIGLSQTIRRYLSISYDSEQSH